MDDDLAIQATSRESYISKQKSSRKSFAQAQEGMQVIHFDNLKSKGWDVMTHGLFLTYPHHEAAGLLTFSYVRSGTKVWGYIDLKGVDHTDQASVLKAWGEYYSQPMACETYNNGVQLGTVLLSQGGIL